MKKRMIAMLCLVVAISMMVSAAAVAEINRITDEPITLKYWIPLGDKASQVITSNAEIPVYDVLQEKTGVEIEWIHSSNTDTATQLNLLIASKNLPDMIFFNWQNQYQGGLAKAVADQVAIPLNDLIDEYAPNLQALFEKCPELAKQLALDDGTIAMFPSARTDPITRVWFGPQIRQDWLENLNLEMPTNIAEWYNVLTAFKEQDANGNGDPNDEIPFVAAGSDNLKVYLLSFAGAYGLVRMDFCLHGDEVVYSPADPAYKDFLTEMAKWYAEELIDPDFAAMDGASVKSMITTDAAGAFFGSLAGNLGGYNAVLKEVCPEGQIVGAPWVAMANGKVYQQEGEHARALTGNGAIVTTACQYPEIAVQWLDAHLSDEGHMLMVFGIEGESYEMIDGYPTFTDEIMNNPDGLTYDIALAKYSLKPNTSEVMDDDGRCMEQYSLQTEAQKDAAAVWGAGDLSLLMPPVSMTTEESQEYSKIMSEVNTYASECIVKFIMGQMDLNEFDAFVENMNGMGLQRAIEIQQAAYDRYQAR